MTLGVVLPMPSGAGGVVGVVVVGGGVGVVSVVPGGGGGVVVVPVDGTSAGAGGELGGA